MKVAVRSAEEYSGITQFLIQTLTELKHEIEIVDSGLDGDVVMYVITKQNWQGVWALIGSLWGLRPEAAILFIEPYLPRRIAGSLSATCSKQELQQALLAL